MDVLEKQQTIEAISTVVKARWFYISTILLTGFVVKLFFSGVPLLSIFNFSLIALAGLSYNFVYWLYIRRPPQKISDWGLKIVKISQVIGDQLAISVILYFSGTANKAMVVFYLVTVMIASSLYGKKGIIFSTIFSMLIFSVTAFLEYFGLMPSLSPEAFTQAPGKPLAGNSGITKAFIVSFNLYLIAAAFVAGYIASLFRRREKRLVDQKNDLTQKSDLLIQQTEELSRTKDWLHEALTKSDKSRTELSKIKDDLEKSNSELKAKIEELEKYGQVTTGRELKMAELKEKIKALEIRVKELGQDQ